MSRSLPVQAAMPSKMPAAGLLQLFDPAMCCPTGLCGPGVDPALLSIARDLRWLEAQGVVVERYGLSQAPDVFVAQGKIAGLMQAFGDRALPATLLNGDVLTFGRYPSRDEIMAALKAAPPASAEMAGGCIPGSGCCS